jgi:phospholipid/cholesterol/gamma-HCH transport system substrate-binding protein
MSTSHSATRPWAKWTTRLVVVAILAAAIGFWWYRANRTGMHLAAQFSAAVGVYPGSDVRMLGVAVGAVDSVHADGTYVTIDMHLNPGVKLAADSKAVIVSPNLVSDRYVQLTGVYQSGAQFESGATIPLSDTATPVELDTLYRNLISLTGALGPEGANKTGALSDLINTAAANLNGNGKNFNDTVGNLAKAASTLTSTKDDLFLTISHLSDFTGMLATNNNGLIKVNDELASVTQVLSDDRQSFGDAIHELGIALDKVQGFVHDNRSAISENVAKLSVVAQTLAKQRNGLVKSLRAAPLLVQNLINAYDPTNKAITGRVNLNELSIWAKTAGSASSTDGPPTLLPGTGSR